MSMLVTNKTTSDIYFGPLHLDAGIGSTLTVDDTSATSLYLLNDSVADALNNAYINNQIDVSGAADPFPRPVGTRRSTTAAATLKGSSTRRRDLSTCGGTVY